MTVGIYPPCSVTNDHYWHDGGICTSCGERLRCECGQFARAADSWWDEHLTPENCPFIRSLPECCQTGECEGEHGYGEPGEEQK